MGGGRHGAVIPCLTGNMVWSLIKLGFYEDSRVERGINWIIKYQRFDDGKRPVLKGWQCFSPGGARQRDDTGAHEPSV